MFYICSCLLFDIVNMKTTPARGFCPQEKTGAITVTRPVVVSLFWPGFGRVLAAGAAVTVERQIWTFRDVSGHFRTYRDVSRGICHNAAPRPKASCLRRSGASAPRRQVGRRAVLLRPTRSAVSLLAGFRNVAGRFSTPGDGRSRRPSPCIDRGGLGHYLFRGLFTAGEPTRTVFGDRQFSLPIHSLPIQRYP